LIPVGSVVVADVVVTLLVRIVYGGDGALSTLAGVVLGSVAVVAVHRIGLRVGRRFAFGAAAMVFVVPLLGAAYALGTYRPTYTHHSLPALFGLAHPGWFAIGVGLAVASAFAPATTTAAAGVLAAVGAAVVWGVSPLGDVTNALHETAWSITFIEWLPVAGVLGLVRKAPWSAVGTAGWLVFFVLRAAHRSFDEGAFWAALAPAVPAAALLLAAIALLVPRRSPAARPAPDPR
jgi:hypothetical protein